MNSEAQGAQPRLSYVFHVMGMPFNGDTIKTKSLGGSESAAYYQALELARRGHRVVCFTSNQEKDSVSDGVQWCSLGAPTELNPLGDRFEYYARNTPHDVLIIQRHPHAFYKPFASKVNVWQLHDLALFRHSPEMVPGLWQCDAVTGVSDWHTQQIKDVFGINPEVVRAVPNGVDPAVYASAPTNFVTVAKEGERIGRDPETGRVVLPPNRFVLLYQSRPERGLEHLLRPGGIMDRCQSLPVHLVVCGYENTTAQMASYYERLRAWGEALPNVTAVGALSKAELAALQMRADLLLYPTEFEEVSCITAMEAMHAALPMLTSDVGALSETCEGSGTVLLPLKDGKADEDAFCAWLHETFGDAIPGTFPARLNTMRVLQRASAPRKTWPKAVDRLEEVVAECFAKRHANPLTVVRDAIEHSDIGFAQWVMETTRPEATDFSLTLRGELDRMYSFAASPEAYAAHYAKHQTAYYDEFEEKVIGEDVTGTTRYRGVVDMIGTAYAAHPKSREGLRVLDYGCAHGHYTIPLAKMFFNCDFVGMDISQRAVDAATKWADKAGVTNVEFTQGSQASLDPDTVGYFDVILAGEVLEHVWDYHELLSKFQGLLAPGGTIVVTTPLGRWEHSGTVPFRTAREHLHHFDRADIEDICGSHPHRFLHAPASHDRAGFPLGSWVWSVTPTAGVPLWKVSYARKLSTYAPRRQTISVCMIVKDGDRTLRKCVESFIDWVDELVIAVDPETKDRTRQVASDIQGDFPNRSVVIVDGLSAMKEGFDAARNFSISHASGDWIVWCDADEEIRHPWRLQTLARPSHHNGFGFGQVHYSADPPQVLTEDMPTRMFRNHAGIKFYGVVHEHPQSNDTDPVLYSLVRPDVKFLHNGYVDEESRKGRFRRNLPLLHRDRKQYPQRTLNKFLMLRDIAQGIIFEAEQAGGHLPDHAERGEEGVALMLELAEQPQVRMIADAMPYYSQCVLATGRPSFDAELTMKTAKPEAPGLSVSLNLKGRFHSREFYMQLVRKLTEESTKQYEARYL